MSSDLFTYGPDGTPLDDANPYLDLGSCDEQPAALTRWDDERPATMRWSARSNSITVEVPPSAAVTLYLGDGGQDSDDEDDEQVYAPLAELEEDEYAATEALPPDADILARIDAVTADLCVCGCRRAIPPDGASEFFAAPGCQRRWHGERATDPGDVYARRDAAQVRPLADHLPIPLQAPDGNNDTVTVPPRLQEHVPAAIRLPSCTDPRGAGYRRLCHRCQEMVIPDVFMDDQVDIMEWGNAQPVRTVAGAQVRHQCPVCHEQLPDPAYAALVVDDGMQLTLELHDTTARARAAVTHRRLTAATDPAGLIAQTWAGLERQLSKFRRAWLGSGARR